MGHPEAPSCRLSRWQLLISFTCGLTCAGMSHAESGAWSVTPSVHVEGSHDDNGSLSATAPNTINGLWLSTAVAVARTRPDSEIRGLLGADFPHFTGEDAPPDGNQYLAFDGFQRTRRSTWALNATLQRDSLLRTVELPPSPSAAVPIGNIDVALVTVPVRRDRYQVNPSWKYDLTRLDSLSLSYGFTAERFEQTAGANVVNYNNHAFGIGLGHRLSPTDLVSVTARAERFDPENLKTVDNYALVADYSHSYSPVQSVGFELGGRSVKGVQTETGLIMGLSWNGRTRLSTTLVKVERQLYPSGFGDLTETDQVLATWNTKLSRMTQLRLTGRAFHSNSIAASSQYDERYAEADTELKHSLDRWWSIGAAYHYRWIDRNTDPGSADSNAFFLSVGYEEPLMLK